jgi:hypothetical protein
MVLRNAAIVLSLCLAGCADVAVQPAGLTTGTVRQHLDAAVAAASAWQPGAALIGVTGERVDGFGQIVCDPSDLSTGWRFDFYGDGKINTFRYQGCGNSHDSVEVPGAAPDLGKGLGLDFVDSTVIVDKLSRAASDHRFMDCSFSAGLQNNSNLVKGLDPQRVVWVGIAACDDLSMRIVMDAATKEVYAEGVQRMPGQRP